MEKFAHFHEKLDEIRKLGRERRILAVGAEFSENSEISKNSEKILDLSSNNYLRLSRDPEIIAGAIAAIQRYGASTSASPLVNGYKQIHAELERELCDWLNFPHALIWNTGHAANSCLLATLPRAGDLILADRLIHNSMICGAMRSRAKFERFRHNDFADLRSRLEKFRAENPAGTIFVATESVFSMDGDVPDLAKIAQLRAEFNFIFIVDEAHATGWFGPNGGGKIDEVGLARDVDILVGTLGKSLGSAGAYTLFNDEILRNFLINFGAEFIFSTYLPPSACGAALAAIRKIRQFSSREREHLHAISRAWRERLREIFPSVPAGDSPVVPVQIGDEQLTLELAQFLRSRGFFVGAIRPPSVPAGTARLRISLNKNLVPADLENFAGTLKSFFNRHADLLTSNDVRDLKISRESLDSSKSVWHKNSVPVKFLVLSGWGILPENLAKIFPAGTQILPPTRENADKILTEIAAGTAKFAFAYSLGAWLLLEAATRVPANFSCKNVALFAPFLAFPREAEKGGKIARTQVKFLRRWLAKNPVPALADFYQRAQILSFPPPTESQISSMFERDFGLDFGLEMLCGNGLESVPAAAQNWQIFLGENDSLLDSRAVAATFPQNPLKIIPAGTHDLATIFDENEIDF